MMKVEDKRKKGEKGFWSKIANRYDKWIDRAFADQYEAFKSKISSYMQPDDAVLEVGTGTGEIAFHIADHCKKVVGIDISPEMVTIANRKKNETDIKNVTFQVEDAYELPFADSSFDKVICINALQTMKEPLKAIMEGKRVLKEGGEFISITYCYGDSSFLEKLKLIKWVILYGFPKYWNNFSRNELTGYFERVNFKVIEKEDVWKKPIVLFLRCGKVT